MKNHQHYIICTWWLIHTHTHIVLIRYTKLCKTSSTVFLSHLGTYTFYQYSLTKMKRNYEFPYLSLFFNVIIFGINDWLIQGSSMNKKEYSRVPWLFMFLRTPLLCLKQVLVPTGSVASQGCQLPYLLIDVTCLPYT